MAVFPEPPNSSRVVEIAQYMNDITSGQFWAWMIVAIYFVMLLRLNGVTSGKNAATAAAFVTTMLAGLLSFSGLVGAWTAGILAVLTVAGAIYMYIHEDVSF